VDVQCLAGTRQAAVVAEVNLKGVDQVGAMLFVVVQDWSDDCAPCYNDRMTCVQVSTDATGTLTQVVDVTRDVPGPLLALIGGVFGRGDGKDIAPVWNN
jgi:hypothetical protein